MFNSNLRAAAATALVMATFGAESLIHSDEAFQEPRPAVKKVAKPTKPATAAQPPRFDFLGDPLPADAVARLGSNRLRHGHLVWDVVYSPDGKTVASAGHDHTVRLWDTATGKEVRRFLMGDESDKPYSPTRWCNCIAFSPDGKSLACGLYASGWTVNGMRIWEVATAKVLHDFKGPLGGVLAITYAPDGSSLAASGMDSSIAFYDPNTGQQQRTWKAHDGPVRSIAFSPDGKTLASAGDDQTVRLWEAATNKELHKLTGHQAEVESVCFFPDGKSVASGSRDKTVRLWDVASGKERAVWSGHDDAILRVAIAPNGKTLVSACKDKSIMLWDVAAGKPKHTLKGHSLEVRGLCFSPDSGTLASASPDRRVYFWDVKTGNPLLRQPGPGESAIGLRFVDGGKTLLSISRDDTIRWWDWHTGKQVRSVPWHTLMLPRCVAFSPVGDLVALGTPQGVVRLLSVKSGDEVARLDAGKAATVAVAFSADGKTLGATDGTNTHVWDVATRRLIRAMADGGGCQFLAFAPDGKLLVGMERGSQLWDLTKGQPIRTLPVSFTEHTQSAIFSPDSSLLACGTMNGTVELWNVQTGEKVRELTGLAGYVPALSFSPDGRTLAGGGWRGVTVWEMATGQQRRSFHDLEGDAMSIAFSPDGRVLASEAGNGTLLIWDIPGRDLTLKAGDDPKALQALGQDLGADAQKAHRAIWSLVARPAKAVPYLRMLFKPGARADNPAIPQLIKDLDSDRFEAREKASQELHKLGEQAEPALRKAAADAKSPEVEQRARELLAKLGSAPITPERLQALRAIETLEYIHTSEALALLREIADGPSAAPIKREAAAALQRMATTVQNANAPLRTGSLP